MLKRAILGLLAGTVLVLPLVGGVPATAETAAPTIQAVTITYDDSQAAEFKSVVAQGVAIWNSKAPNVRIVKAAIGQRINVRVIADNNWPRATLGPVRPSGSGTVFMGRLAVQQGHNPLRIASHEFGHILGLPDRKPGPCSSLMSGSSAGTSCTNPNPNATEVAEVQRNYSFGLSTQRQQDQAVMIVDAG